MIDMLEERLNMITFGQLVSLENEKIIKLEGIGITLHRCGKVPTKGIRGLKDLGWIKYRIELEDQDWYKYNYINVMPYRITKEDLESAKIYKSGVSFEDAERPHIDWNSGNIHPKFEGLDNTKFEKRKIKQVVLVTKTGPAISECFSERCYEYKASLKVTKDQGEREIPETAPRYVPKACYYPLIKGSIDPSEKEDVEKSSGQKLLKNICAALIEKVETNC